MMIVPGVSGAILAAALLLAACASAPTALAQTGSGAPLKETVPTLTVSGRAELRKPADQFELTIGVVTDHDDATQAMRDNSRAMQRVVDAVRDAGLGEREYETGRFQLTPRYSARPPRPEPDWQQRIIGYRVTNTIQVRTKQLELAGRIIQKANEAGANTIDNIRFTLADPRTHRSEAIATATNHAQADAHDLARAAHVRLVRIVTIALDDAQPPRPIAYDRAVMMEAAEPDAPPIAPGEVTVRAAVNIVYEIAPAGN